MWPLAFSLLLSFVGCWSRSLVRLFLFLFSSEPFYQLNSSRLFPASYAVFRRVFADRASRSPARSCVRRPVSPWSTRTDPASSPQSSATSALCRCICIFSSMLCPVFHFCSFLRVVFVPHDIFCFLSVACRAGQCNDLIASQAGRFVDEHAVGWQGERTLWQVRPTLAVESQTCFLALFFCLC